MSARRGGLPDGELCAVDGEGVPPAGWPAASVTVPVGRTGQVCQELAPLVIVAAWRSLRMTARLLPDPDDDAVSVARFSGRAGDNVQCVPPSVDQAASRWADGARPAASIAVVVPPVVVRRSTVMGWWV